MFKIICDTVLISLDIIDYSNKVVAPAVRKYNAFIKYDNCQACSVTMLPLSYTSEKPNSRVVNKAINIYNANALNPFNEDYFDKYQSILDKISDGQIDINHMKFIALFAIDSGLATLINVPVLEVFQAIIDVSYTPLLTLSDNYETGYSQHYKKYWIIQATNSTGNTFIMSGVVNQIKSGKYSGHYTIAKTAVAYCMKNNILQCLPIQYEDDVSINNQEIYDYVSNYINSAKQEVISLLYKNLSLVRQCIKDGELLVLVDVAKSDDLSSICEIMGGKLTSMEEIMLQICNKDPSKNLGQNDLFNINCENYKSYVLFDQSGDIIDINSIKTETLREIGSRYYEDAFHTEL